MDKKLVSTDKAPAAIGPYNQAVVTGGLVYCSGQIPLDAASMKLIEGGIEEQTQRVLENLGEVLKAAGSGYDKVVKCTVYLKSMGDFVAMNKVYGNFFSENSPARATVAVSGLPMDVMVEIDCIAIV